MSITTPNLSPQISQRAALEQSVSPAQLEIIQMLTKQAQQPAGLTQEFIGDLLSNKIKAYRNVFLIMKQQKSTREFIRLFQELHDEIKVLTYLHQKVLHHRLTD